MHKLALDQLEQDIKGKCEEKVFKKEMQLQEKVNLIRGELKVKAERMERHKAKKQQQHEEGMEKNNEYMRTYMAKVKEDRIESEVRREMAIKSRFEEGERREKCRKMADNVHRFSDEILKK